MTDSCGDDSQAEDDLPGGGRPRRRSRLSRLGIAALVLAVPAGGILWLFQDELFHPFGDPRACEGSDARLSDAIGTLLPPDASDVHYVTHDGRSEVSFASGRTAEFLHRANLVPQGESPLDGQDGGAYALGEGDSELPEGLCGPGIRGPVASYTGTAVTVLVERSPYTVERFRNPARVMVTYTQP
ncbi:hypothetical protein ABT001_04275 [Streptomyces sp. NPDC002793]|uniref:hypothetical protein n=1 Tax=Streptomyces sp. NPDC002793 TaxID=3154432 RepID=UPI00332C03C0